MDRAALVDRSLEVLLDESLAHVVDVALCARDGLIEAHRHDGAVGFAPSGDVRWVRGRNPLERQDPSAMSPLAQELANRYPRDGDNSYPYAYRNAAQLFGARCAPDVAVVHTAAHNWEERGGHRGEHGSLDVVQSRAPLIVSGAGVRAEGRVEDHARMVDVAPTIGALLGIEAAGAAYDGHPIARVIDAGEKPERVVVFLCDGTNANVLYSMAEAGELPAVARLMESGTTFAHGLLASFPSVTLANHTTAVTGAHPGRHGILNNFYYDRDARRRVVANSPETWHLARGEISRDVETVFESVGRAGRGFTAAVDEPADRGADYSTFDFLRRGEVTEIQSALPDPSAGIPDATRAFVDLKRDYAWASAADHMAVQQAASLWAGAAGNPRPALTWVNLILNDAANHAGGPHSEIGHAGLRDTDRRLGRILDAMDWGGGRTAFVVLADHGMEESDPECRGDFDAALERAGIPFRDEGYGFLYLGESPD